MRFHLKATIALTVKASLTLTTKAMITLMTAICFCCGVLHGQESEKKPETEKKPEKIRKNIIRYNLSSSLLFGIDKYYVFGYERVVGPHQSFSVNFGAACLPKLVAFSTDSLNLKTDAKNNGYNFSVDYRFYLAKENKYNAPHGFYIGPYYSLNHFHRVNDWSYQKSGGVEQLFTTTTDFTINTIGGEIGYQVILWKRISLDFVMVGPGISNYYLTAKLDNGLTDAQKQQVQKALTQLITQKFPGMNYVFTGKEFNANGSIKTWNFGYRYLIHIGFLF
jgi:hypothetical protein